MREIISLIAVYLGVFLMFIASLGLFRFPDAFTRMSAVTKAVTFKIGLVMLGVSLYFDSLPVILKAILVVFFLLLTTPVSSHLLAREAYLFKVPLWRKLLADEFEEYASEKRKKTAEPGDGTSTENQKDKAK